MENEGDGLVLDTANFLCGMTPATAGLPDDDASTDQEGASDGDRQCNGD